jgi:ribosome maturation factor RimP
LAVNDITVTITELLEPVASEHGFDLVAVEQAGGRGTPVIRVLLDHEGGLDLDSICHANSWVSDALEDLEVLSGPYTLEVSSPGIDRPLRRLQDFERFAGETVSIKLRSEAGGRHKWTGRIEGTDGSSIVIDADSERVVIPFEDVVKARLKGVVNFNSERGAE